MKSFPLSNRINERTGWKSFDFKDSSGQKGRLSFYSDKTADKDARLMAAAPAMLHALELVYSNAADHPDKIRAIIDEALIHLEGKP